MPQSENSNLREYWNAALKFSDLEVACFLIGDTGTLVSPLALNQLRGLTDAKIKAILNNEKVPGVVDINLIAGIKKFREGYATDQEFINALNKFKIKLGDALTQGGMNKNWSLDPRINTKGALQEAKDPDKFDGVMSRLFNEWPMEHFQNLEGMKKNFCGLIKDVVKEVNTNKKLEAIPDLVDSLKNIKSAEGTTAADFNAVLDNVPVLKQKMQSLCMDMALQGLRNFCDGDGLSSDIRDMFQLDSLAGNANGEISEDKQLAILGKFLEGYVGQIAEPKPDELREQFNADKDGQALEIIKTGGVSREINEYLKGGILKQQLPYLLSLIKFEKQLELSKQQLSEDHPVCKSSQQLLNQCQKEVRLLLEDPEKNKNQLLELKKAMDSGANILKEPQNAKHVEKVDKFVENAVHVKKNEVKSKCYQFAANVCGLMGKKEKQFKYSSKARELLRGIQIYHGKLFADSPTLTTPDKQSSSLKEKIGKYTRR